MPVPAQNSCLREFVNRNKGIYVLPHLESNFENCYHQLFGLLNQIQKEEHVLMYSILMLPKDNQKRKEVYNILFKKGLVFDFVLENISTSNKQEIEDELKIYDLKKLTSSMEILNKYLNQK